MSEAGKTDSGRGRQAQWPSQIPPAGWKDILWRVWSETNEDRVLLIAAGGTFYLLLSLFPALAAFASIYGFLADPASIRDQLSALQGVVPDGGIDIMREQLENLAGQQTDRLSASFVLGLAIAFWSANSGTKTLFEALNIAYEEEEKRSFIRLNLFAFAMTLGVMIVAILLIAMVGVLPAIFAMLPMGGYLEIVLRLARWPAFMLLAFIGISILYRYGPSRQNAKWRWITWGSALATVVWLAASFGLSWYLENFADYNATYGSLGAVVGFMLWVWISIAILIVGAELDAEMEHQTTRDSTTGPPKPMGSRGAVVADTLGRAAGDPDDAVVGKK